MTRRSLHLRLLILVSLVVLAAAGAYVFTASNTVPDTHAGSGSGTISGYAISDVKYNLAAADPSSIDSVTFTISPDTATTVKIQLDTVAGTWYGCTNSAGAVTCTTTGATVKPADKLTVVATE